MATSFVKAATAAAYCACLLVSPAFPAESLRYLEGQPNAFSRLVQGAKAKGLYGTGVNIMTSYRGESFGLLHFKVLVENEAPTPLDVSPSYMSLEVGKQVLPAVPIEAYCQQLDMTPEKAQIMTANFGRMAATTVKAQQYTNREIAAQFRQEAMLGTTLQQGQISLGSVYFKKPRNMDGPLLLRILLGENTYTFPFVNSDASM